MDKKQQELFEQLAHEKGFATVDEYKDHLLEDLHKHQAEWESMPRWKREVIRLRQKISYRIWGFMYWLGWGEE